MAKDKCDRNCKTCGIDNRSYCAVQISLANQEMLMQLGQSIANLANAMSPLLTPGENIVPPVTEEEGIVPKAEKK